MKSEEKPSKKLRKMGIYFPAFEKILDKEDESGKK